MSIPIFHIVLFYSEFETDLVAQLYTDDNVPNTELPVPSIISGTYYFYNNGILIDTVQLNNTNGVVTLGDISNRCGEIYQVVADYIVDDVVSQQSTDTVIIGDNSIMIESLITSTSNGDGTYTIELTPPVGISPVDIFWVYDYDNILPISDTEFIATQDGIYEVIFSDNNNGSIYYSIHELVGAEPTMYIRLVDSLGNIYGTLGTPPQVGTLNVQVVNNNNAPYLYKIYVNGTQISSNPFIRLTDFELEDIINVSVTDCCGITLTANTYIMPCDSVPVQQRDRILNTDNKSAGELIKVSTEEPIENSIIDVDSAKESKEDSMTESLIESDRRKRNIEILHTKLTKLKTRSRMIKLPRPPKIKRRN